MSVIAQNHDWLCGSLGCVKFGFKANLEKGKCFGCEI